ncbi:MAG: leucyl aminopeptidase [Chloroflexota bacterium]
MEINVQAGDISGVRADAIIVSLFEGAGPPSGATKVVDDALDGLITRLIQAREITGELYQVTVLHTFGRLPADRVTVVGLGKQEGFVLDRVRGVIAEALRALQKMGLQRVASVLHGAGQGGLHPEAVAQALAEGALLGLYAFDKYSTKKPEPQIQELSLVAFDPAVLEPVSRGLSRGKVMAQATNLARDLINEPANYLTPSEWARQAERLAQADGLECQVLDQEQMHEMGMGALLGVAQGSAQPPKLIVLRYRGDERGRKPALGLVGKGITFDSGGLSLKPREAMDAMKGDMAGGAAVMAAMGAIAQLQLPLNVTAIVPATENMPGGRALKLGDILRAMSGKTIEILSTDAEGRLVLADALCYARKLGLSPLVDVATLTGACSIALGPVYAGAFGNNQELIDRLLKAGEEAGEHFWAMPMHPDYKELIKSDVADMKNVGGRAGGAITAAHFLANFVDDTPWVHLDIAGSSFSDKDKTYNPKGGRGMAVRTLINLARSLADD